MLLVCTTLVHEKETLTKRRRFSGPHLPNGVALVNDLVADVADVSSNAGEDGALGSDEGRDVASP